MSEETTVEEIAVTEPVSNNLINSSLQERDKQMLQDIAHRLLLLY